MHYILNGDPKNISFNIFVGTIYLLYANTLISINFLTRKKS